MNKIVYDIIWKKRADILTLLIGDFKSQAPSKTRIWPFESESENIQKTDKTAIKESLNCLPKAFYCHKILINILFVQMLRCGSAMCSFCIHFPLMISLIQLIGNKT